MRFRQNFTQTNYVYNKYNEARALGEKLSEGGEGSVIALQDPNHHVVVKIYKQEKLNKWGRLLENKLDAQVKLQQIFEQTNIAWPKLLVYNQGRNFIGYAMKRVNGIPLSKLAHPLLQQKYFPNYNRIDLVQVVLSIIESVKKLHENGIFIGDINLENFLVEQNTRTVYLIDTDSYQVNHNGRIYPCLVGRPEMTPVEHHDQPFEAITRTRESDLFSLGIVFFQILMRGRHPYDQIGGGNPVENLKSGNFPYGKGSRPPGQEGAIPPGPWYIIWSHLSYKVKELFIKCFKEGVYNPNQRPSLQDWEDRFRAYLQSLQKGHLDNTIQPREPKR